MQIILKDSEYAFDASNNTITLVEPYTALSLGQVISIVNLTTGDDIYLLKKLIHPISITAAVITHTYDNSSHADTDKLQITIDVSPVVTNSSTGTTTDASANALDWACSGFNDKNIHLENTDSSNNLKYKVLTYAYRGGVEHEEVAETTLNYGDTAQIVLEQAYATVIIKVRSSTPGSHATYQVDYVGNRGGV